MAGFFGLFGGNKGDSEERGAYYLNSDDAKTFGDINYMRSAKTVKRTFAKKKGAEELESVRQVSAMGAAEVQENGLPVMKSTQADQSTPQASTSNFESKTTQRRKADNSMDMFRNMARDIKR
ncbi:MAG: hypothetical protein AAFW84_23085 [Cyanobacteria bacterium J06635_15]